MQRTTLLLLLTVATAVLSSTSYAFPQTGSGGSQARATTVRTRCARPGCGFSGDSALRERQEQLLLNIDSLRWQYENVRMSDAERLRMRQEIRRAFETLEATMVESSMPGGMLRGPAPRAAIAGGGPAMAGPRMVAVETECKTTGYLGVTIDGMKQEECTSNNERIVRFFQYPQVAFVDRSSPAERAGILQGDTLVSLNGTDVTQSAISFTKLLVPQARIVVRVRREGDAKDLPVIVGEAPSYYRLRAVPITPRAPFPQEPAVRVEVYAPPRTPAPPMPAAVWSSGEGLAGAHVQTISEGLGKAVGVKEGVLVISVTPGTPAYRSGLRDGDVIVRAADRDVSDVRTLGRILREGGDDGFVKLRIRRERRDRDLTLRWKDLER